MKQKVVKLSKVNYSSSTGSAIKPTNNRRLQMQITVEIKNVYGNEAVYPVCEASKLFARIAGTRTLTRHALRDIQALGYAVEVKQKEFTI
jgi:hypothetical protein